MANVDSATLDDGEQQIAAARQFESERLQQNLTKQRQANKSRPDVTKASVDQAITALSKSPAAANPYVRGILLINNLLNRMLGKPPDSTETISTAMMVVIPMIMFINLALVTIFVAAVLYGGFIYINPLLTGVGKIFAFFCWLSEIFGNTCGVL